MTGLLSPHAASPGAVEVSQRLRDASAHGTAQRLIGRGHWLDAGWPVRDAVPLALGSLSDVIDYTPGDLTLTAGAGTPLTAIAELTARESQWLALDPSGAPDGSIGATVATASAGPLAHAFGTPRDIVLGLEGATSRGDLVRGGGRVVKNVAGFDLARLFTGSWGTLAAITEVTVRLRALPDCDESVAVPVADAPEALGEFLVHLRAAPLAAMAMELVNGALARQLGLAAATTLLVRLGGNADLVRAQRQSLAALAAPHAEPFDFPPSIWGALATVEPTDAAVVRLSSPTSGIPATWRLATAIRGVLAHATVSRGIVRCILPRDPGGGADSDVSPVAALIAAATRAGCTIIPERLSASEWASTPVPSPIRDPLSRAIRAAFDPAGVLNPGVLEGEMSDSQMVRQSERAIVH